jgi:hypothetical protein
MRAEGVRVYENELTGRDGGLHGDDRRLAVGTHCGRDGCSAVEWLHEPIVVHPNQINAAATAAEHEYGAVRQQTDIPGGLQIE